MAQFAEQIPGLVRDADYPVLHATGIEGAWDFTISYNEAELFESLRVLLAARRGADGADNAGQASDPTGGLSLTAAMEKELGLKLKTHRRPERVFVIDHIEQKPAGN